jgi:hypothetical protein
MGACLGEKPTSGTPNGCALPPNEGLSTKAISGWRRLLWLVSTASPPQRPCTWSPAASASELQHHAKSATVRAPHQRRLGLLSDAGRRPSHLDQPEPRVARDGTAQGSAAALAGPPSSAVAGAQRSVEQRRVRVAEPHRGPDGRRSSSRRSAFRGPVHRRGAFASSSSMAAIPEDGSPASPR